MADNKKNKKKNPYTIYWIYAGIALAIIAVQLFMSSGKTSTIQSMGTFSELMEEGYVENVKLIRNEGRVDFKLTDAGVEAIKGDGLPAEIQNGDKTKLRNAVQNRGTSFGKTSNPSFSFKIADASSFREDFNRINQERAEQGENKVPDYAVEDEINYFSGIISFLLPILIIVVIWLFIMRRMSGGGAGGGSAKKAA